MAKAIHISRLQGLLWQDKKSVDYIESTHTNLL